MPLKSIEVCDFKSYRGHQVIGPFTHFNSIIGPNGAGKSNLMDAISFVLGVKSAQLRSSQLKDLVYRGRKLVEDNGEGPSDTSLNLEDDRDGDGTASRAWVLAVYEDFEGKEWKFKRTIALTGSSEYQINGKTCTYLNYNAALEKHNILVKAKNFLVFQGDVEAVASQSPQALTKLVEQISGSLELAGEYDDALKNQERATENATFNYTKRRGINGEIKQFKEQKAEAQRFEKLVEQKDEQILYRHLWKLFHIEESLEENTRLIKAGAKNLSSLKKGLKTEATALAKARETQAAARAEVMSKEKKIKKAEKSLDNKRPDVTAIEAQIAHIQRKREKAENIKSNVKKDLARQEDTVKRLQKDLDEVVKASQAAEEASRKASAKKDISLSPENLEEYRRLKTEANVLHVSERQKLEVLQREEKTYCQKLSELEERHGEHTDKKTALEEEAGKLNDRKGELEGRVASLQTDLRTAKQELEKAQSERERISRTETEINERLHDVHNKLLQAGADRKESEREANLKETFATLQRIFPGVRGRVIDLCKPTQRKFESAVSVILGRNIDAVVVDQEKTAIDCIQYMRDQRAGQATFLPLDTLQVKPINDKYRSFAKGARLAVDVLEFDGSVERAIHYACGNALVCDTMDIARHVVYDKGQEVKAVTLEGTIIHKSGLITGGRSTHGSGKKWNDKDFQGLTKQKDNLLAQLRELNQSKVRSSRDDNLVTEITRLESSLALVTDDLNGVSFRLSGIKEELGHISRETKMLKPEVDKVKKSLSRLEDQMSGLRSVVEAAEDRVFDTFCRRLKVDNIREYEGRQLKLVQGESDAKLRYGTQIARLNTAINFDKGRIQDLQERLDALEKAAHAESNVLQTLNTSLKTAQVEVRQAEDAVEALKEELRGLNDVFEEKTKDLEAAKKEHDKANKAFEKVLKDISSRNDDIEKLAATRSSIYRKCRLENINLPLNSGSLNNVPMEDISKDETAMEVDEVEDEIRPKGVDDYGIEVDFSDLEEDDREDGSPEIGAKLEASIAKLNAEIERMTPNMKAMDKLADVEHKLAEMDKDTERARKESKFARDRFQAVKKQRTDLFMKAFEHISSRIDSVYKELTKGKASPMGGVAYLSLEESDEPYLGGVKYHAMPPMKRFRDMEQLSGGEKTIAALALLFAIHSYQPSPFFVLDEVDAALDNTNVAKIANYIRSQASDSFQFIVISLKGSLYERSNSLVGIYRDQDVNSSKTLTLDLTQYDD